MLGADGSAIDMATIGTGFAVVAIRLVKNVVTERRLAYDRTKAIVDFLNGSTMVPFVLLLASAFWKSIRADVLNSTVWLAIAGGVGLLFLVGEIFPGVKPDAGKQDP